MTVTVVTPASYVHAAGVCRQESLHACSHIESRTGYVYHGERGDDHQTTLQIQSSRGNVGFT
jgi:hypothetical protein